jgi:tetratricopeptide (TPR) repeat protein
LAKKITNKKEAVKSHISTVRKHRRVFTLLAVLLPFIFIFFIEAGLRLFGYGHDYSLFVKDENHPGFLHMNPNVSGKYFTQKDNATVGNQDVFREKKAPGTFRIFVLGESSALGYPYLHNGAFPRWLQFRLMSSYPGKNFEVINLSLTAINSITLYDFAKQVIHYQPDAILVYAGHNEYYGALGPASTSYIGRNTYLIRLMLKLKQLRFVQLLSNAYVKLRGFSAKRVNLKDNLMERMVSEQKVVWGSVLYKDGLTQFRNNLHDMFTLFRDNNIPVFISTLASNEKDLKPFISELSDTAHAKKFFQVFDKGVISISKEDTASAEGYFLQSLKIDSSYALCDYYLGKIAYSNGRFDSARNYFDKARENDCLRFRAPEAINLIIEEETKLFPNVKLVPGEKEFREHSPHGIIGKETILEHLHPNLYGYALLSDAFFTKMKTENLFGPQLNYNMSFEDLLSKMPVTKVDSLHGVYEIMMLKEGWPFNEPIPSKQTPPAGMEEQIAGAYSVQQITWVQAMGMLYNYYGENNRMADALKVAEALQLEFPLESKYDNDAGNLYLNLFKYEKAVFYFKKSFELDGNLSSAEQLIIALLKMDKPEDALAYFEILKHNNIQRFIEMEPLVKNVILMKSRYEQDSTNVLYCNEVAVAYLKFANTEAAQKYISRSFQLQPGNTDATTIEKIIHQIINSK